jgi:hypothetical protein
VIGKQVKPKVAVLITGVVRSPPGI